MSDDLTRRADIVLQRLHAAEDVYSKHEGNRRIGLAVGKLNKQAPTTQRFLLEEWVGREFFDDDAQWNKERRRALEWIRENGLRENFIAVMLGEKTRDGVNVTDTPEHRL